MIRGFALAGLAVVFCGAVFGQAGATQLSATPVSFEVADVRVNQGGGAAPSGKFLPGGRLDLRELTLKQIIGIAYDVDEDMVSGGPNWLDSDHFDVVAKADPKSSRENLRLMLQTLLADQFKLVVQQTEKVVPVYALVVRKGGPKLQATTSDDSAKRVCRRENPDEPNRLGIHLACSKVTMAEFAVELANRGKSYFDVPIVDMTELKGAYDLKLLWTPKRALEGQKAEDGTVISEPAGGLSIFDALQAQLGLKLEARKIPMPMIVVDRVQRLSDDR